MARKIPGMRKTEYGYEYRFTYDGMRYSVSAKTQNECIERQREKIDSIIKKMPVKGKDKTLADFFDEWLELSEGSVKETTIRNNSVLFRIAAVSEMDELGHTFGGMKLKNIETQHIRIVQKSISKRCSTRTTNDCISLVKRVLQAACNEHILEWNPATGIKSLRRTETPARDSYHRALTKEETRLFLASASSDYYYNLYIFLLSTGCRIGEAGALSLKDISNGKINVRKSITRTKEGTYRVGESTKTAAGVRSIPILPAAQKAIDDQLHQNSVMYGKVVSIGDTLFRSPSGNLLNGTVVNQNITKICKKAKIDRFTAHAFRDTFATRCVESGMQPKTLQEIMGHSDISMTMNLYAHVMDDTKEEQMKLVNVL